VLNVPSTTGGQTKVSGNETEWITVESKKAARQAKRIVSHTSSAETRNDHGNGEAKGKRVRFESEKSSSHFIIIFRFTSYFDLPVVTVVLHRCLIGTKVLAAILWFQH
jgi:hypothetical protein